MFFGKNNMIILKKFHFQDISYYMKKFLSSFLFLLLFNFSASAEECAIMLGDEVDPEEFSESTGKKIYFCCGACVKAFDGAAAYYIKAVPALAEKFTEAEMKELGVDKVKLLDQRVCPIYPERFINPNSKTIEYKGKTIYFWSSSAQRRWKRDPDAYFKEAFEKGHLPQYKS